MVSQYDITHNLSVEQLKKLKSDFKSFKLKNNFPEMTFSQFCDGVIISLLKNFSSRLVFTEVKNDSKK